jgi:uncharacterized protein YoxC
MDILFYISGLITALLVVLVIASLHAYTKYKNLIQYNEFVNSEVASTYAEMGVWKDNLDIWVRQIQNDMKNDGYENITKFENRVQDLSSEVNDLKTSTTSFNNDCYSNFAKLFNDMSSIRNNQQSPTQDIDRY